MTLPEVRAHLQSLADESCAQTLRRFFKAGPGEYGAGDQFLGIKVPPIREAAKRCHGLSLDEVLTLLRSPLHEERLLALKILVLRFAKGSEPARKRIYDLYLANTRFINNWDLVDSSAEFVVGPWLERRDKRPLIRLARSADLWERRIAIISTFHFIRQRNFAPTLRLAAILLNDDHDLIHKAVGWMLREVGKRDLPSEIAFLDAHAAEMPRTMLRYAIERFPEAQRRKFLETSRVRKEIGGKGQRGATR